MVESSRMSAAEQRLRWFLRITAIVLISAAGAVVMPYAWMNSISEALGFGALPNTSLTAYLTRSLSALYVVLGVYCWILSGDLKRYLPLLAWSVPLSLAFSVVLIGIDVFAEMPIWWTSIEGAFLLGWTFLLWRLVNRAQGG
jgi:hypothetical protein